MDHEAFIYCTSQLVRDVVIWRRKSVDTKLISSGIITLPSLKFIIFLTMVTYLTFSKSLTVVVCGTCMNI